MAGISNNALNLVFDDLARLHMRMIGTQASGYGIGQTGQDWGAIAVLSDLINPDLISANDLEPIVEIGDSVLRLEQGFLPFNITASYFGNVLSAIQSHLLGIQINTVSNINTYLTYYNAGVGGTFLLMQHHAFKDLHDAWSPQDCLDIQNVYFEVLLGATDAYLNTTFANALSVFAVTGAGAGNLTAGYTIDPTLYAGGIPQVNVSALAGNGVVTVTGTAFDPASKTSIPAKTWTATINANGRTALAPGGGSPAPANSKITAVSAVAIAAGITAGSIAVEAARPAGRALLP